MFSREFCLREENEFFSRGEDVRVRKFTRSKVKLPKVNVIRGMYGKGRGTEGRDIIEA